jgi:hypothetical protein
MLFDPESRTMLAKEHIDRLQATADAPAPSMRLALSEWLIRAGQRLAPARECSAFAHKALASGRN